jgi:FKBP-type peptidyl-prolyl cis-trans isomerase FklB
VGPGKERETTYAGEFVKMVLAVSLGAMLFLGNGGEPDGAKLSDFTDRASYSLGHQIGRDLVRQDLSIDPEALRKGLLDGLTGAEPAIDPQQMQQLLAELKRRVLTTERQHGQEGDGQDRERGQEFLAENITKDGVIALDSGLQYQVLKKGSGKKPGPADRVIVHYRGTSIDGNVFHDSRKRPGKPETLHVSGVIRGMTEALQLMKVGAKWRLFVPPDLAYGRRGPLADHTLIFEIDLIAIEPGR